MARLTGLLCLLVALAAWAESTLACKKEIALTNSGSSPPTDVTVDAKGRVYVLYEGDGFLDIYSDKGQLLQHRGGKAEEANELISVTPLSQWVGRLGKSALLVSEPRQQVVRAVLIPDKERFFIVPLSGTPQPMQGVAALARDLQGNFYVWVQSDNKVHIFDGNGSFVESVSVSGLKRPRQLAVDSQGQLYCLDAAGLHVFSAQGVAGFDVPGATAMYLTGDDRLALASADWIRRYSSDGKLEVELRDLEHLKDKEPIALSLNDESQFFVYFRDAENGSGMVQKLSPGGRVLSDFPQPTRHPPAPDPGTRLDFQGRLHLWEGKSARLQRIHPSGKVERSMAYLPSSEPKGRLLNPSDLMLDGDTVWIADTGNARLQRFSLSKGGWQKPLGIGIQNGDSKGLPRSLALGRSGLFYAVVYPRRPTGDIVLQTRDMSGKLVAQKTICPAAGDPVVKVACSPVGDLYVYRTRSKGRSGMEDNPTLTRYDARGNKLAEMGGDGPGFAPPGRSLERIVLKPQEDLVFWNGGLLLPTSGVVFRVDPDLNVNQEYKLKFKPGAAGGLRLDDFGGAFVHDKVLYVTDMSNNCVQRVNLP